jgi:DNA-binding winged helix-turn-helix (wHTH) protein
MAKTLRPRPSPRHGNPLQQGGSLAHPSTAGEALAFGRFRVLLRRRQLLADGVPVEIGTRAFDLLLALLDADGSLVTKEELLSRVWPGIIVCEENLKFQISALRKTLGADRDLIRTEVGRGYRFTGALRSDMAEDRGRRSMPSRGRSGLNFSTQSCQSLWRRVNSTAGLRFFQPHSVRGERAGMRPHVPSLFSPGERICRAPRPRFPDATGRKEPSATDRSAFSCQGE